MNASSHSENNNFTAKSENEQDKINRFLFDKANIRGEIASLNKVWQTMQANHSYPEIIRNYLGEVVAASVLLSATLKFDGSMTIQASGDNALTLMVVECHNDFGVRAVAKYEEPLPEETDIKSLLGDGNLVITIEQAKNKERYQGIVALEGNSIAEFLEGYLIRSEQLETRIFLACDDKASAGLLIQQLPGQSDDEDSWERITHLGSTIKPEELLGLDVKEILHRLYHEEDIRLFDAQSIYFKCSCSREKVTNMLRSISHEEASDIIKEQGNISVDCEFCGKEYQFDEIDIAGIYTEHSQTSDPSIRH
ncbi:MAG: Hsp33 family molecular chaperone HslO [gamma proteobacterium symbiont of Lucinoma myriamae]|nr:Hsp33 family molecular chaperone HslO [gamma proteobacterium symbiont of Lucinoma myriamae]MCU7817928.1 Hsp33 family molecular chaperone HslO [gamma proteobacterium symbiont of Lucinoma myriamae]MCU7831319.1 Hsp33 family molecular chaperone HslO [gamma proteobacterium symbiont of Lucinoma myriamae]